MKQNTKITRIILFIVFFGLFFQESSFAVYKPGVEAIKSLKGTDYVDYVQRVYVNPAEENKLMILIKPNYWPMLNQKDKDVILEKTAKKWQEIYAPEPDSVEEPEVRFANI